jgi:selenide,water dikinase
MTRLNKQASAVVSEHKGAHAMTDVTGFGLMGHGREMAMASKVILEIETDAVPRLPGALEAIALGAIPGGLVANREYAECVVSEAPSSRIADELRTLMFDPQTSGGLLISVAPENADTLLTNLNNAEIPAAQIGRVLEGKSGIVLR